jgi:hypothetical protein
MVVTRPTESDHIRLLRGVWIADDNRRLHNLPRLFAKIRGGECNRDFSPITCIPALSWRRLCLSLRRKAIVCRIVLCSPTGLNWLDVFRR